MTVSVRNLDAYYGKSHVVQDVCLDIAPGRITGLLGRNGVGKTTVIKAIMGLVRRTGTVDFDGQDLSGLPPDRIARAGVGYVPQGRQLFPHLTVLENLKLAYHGSSFGAEELERGIGHFAPLRELLHRTAGTLSGGEQQMVAIGRALLNAPRVVLLDEPLEGLSPLFMQRVGEVVASLGERKIAVLLVEQNVHLALSLCQDVLFLEKGQVAHRCPVADARSPNIIRRFLGVTLRYSQNTPSS